MSPHVLSRADCQRGAAIRRDMQRSARQGRIEDYLYISGPGLTVAQAAARLRVTERTIQRYRAELRARDVATGDAPLT